MSDLQPAPAPPPAARARAPWATMGALLAVLGGVYIYRVATGLYHPSVDDYVRMVWSREWGHNFWILTPNPYWPPLPNIVHGAVSGYWTTVNPFLQTLPSVLGLALAVVLLAWPHRARPEFFNGAGAAALMCLPVTHQLAAGHMSEPFFIPALAGLFRAFLSFEAGPSRRAGLWLLVAANFPLWIRYEGWMYSAVLWAWAWAIHLRRHHRGDVTSWTANRWFLLGAGQLSLFPLAWMYQNDRVMGDFLSFLKVAARENRSGPFWVRVEWSFDWTIGAAPVAAVIALAGLALLLRRRDWKTLIVMAIIAFPFFATVLANKIQTVFPERFPTGLHFCGCVLVAAAWQAARESGMLGGRMARVYLPAALAAGVAWAAAQTSVLAAPTPAMELRMAGQRIREEMPPGTRALVLLTPDFRNTMEDTIVLEGGFETARVVHEVWLWREEQPFSAETLRKDNFVAVFYRNPAHLARVAAPLGPERHMAIDWRVRFLLPEDASDDDAKAADNHDATPAS